MKENIEDNNLKNIFKLLKGQTIQEFKIEQKIDQYFYLETEKYNLVFGANDLGVWIENFNEKNKD